MTGPFFSFYQSLSSRSFMLYFLYLNTNQWEQHTSFTKRTWPREQKAPRAKRSPSLWPRIVSRSHLMERNALTWARWELQPFPSVSCDSLMWMSSTLAGIWSRRFLMPSPSSRTCGGWTCTATTLTSSLRPSARWPLCSTSMSATTGWPPTGCP